MQSLSYIGRRYILKSGAALAACAGTLKAASLRVVAAEISALSAVVLMDGRSYEFAARKGTDLGDFKSEIGGFTQACIRVTRDDCALTVYFRPDRDKDRVEVVFELGRLWSGKAADLGPYTATIYAGSTTLAAVDVPKHFWFSRWRWQSEPRPLVTDVKTLIERKLLPPYQLDSDISGEQHPVDAAGGGNSVPTAAVKGLPSGGGPIKIDQASKFTEKGLALGLGSPTGAGGDAAAKTQTLTYTIMGLAGVTPAMGTTGERNDLGLITEHEARYVCTGALDALAITRAQAEAAGTIPWHMRDEHTGAPVDLDAYENMSWYERPDVGKPHIETLNTSGITVDTSHQPSLTYLPYLLTGDPYHLEDQQFAANWNRGQLPPDYRLTVPQIRAFAWALRTLAQTAKITPAVVPKWLLPRAYWEKDLDRIRTWVETSFMKNPSPLYTVFRQIVGPEVFGQDGALLPPGCWVAPWQNEFVASVMGWVVWMGFESWRPIYAWKIGDTLARTSGKSGWVRAHSTTYRMIMRHSNTDPFRSWAEAWQLTSAAYNLTAPDPDDLQVGNDPTYFNYTRGSLVFAKHLGIPTAAENLAWIDDQLIKHGAKRAYKWRFL